nr:SCO family protein [Ardenticatena sp.]
MQHRNRLLGGGIVLGVLILGVWFVIQQMRPPVLNGTAFDPGRTPPDVVMESTRGGEMRLSDLRGKYVVLFFGYTHCPDVCPTTMLKLRNMMAQLSPEEAEQVQVVFVSVDPERDTIERLKGFVESYNPSFIGLRGTPDALAQLATPLGIYYADQSQGETILFDHTASVLLIDPDGNLKLLWAPTLTAEEMAADLKALLR